MLVIALGSLEWLYLHESDLAFLSFFVPKETQDHDINKILLQIYCQQKLNKLSINNCDQVCCMHENCQADGDNFNKGQLSYFESGRGGGRAD